MKRFARTAIVWLVGFTGAAAASAQTPTPMPATGSEFPGYVEVNFGATLGNKSDKSVGGEAGYRVAENIVVFLEGGRIGNAATSAFDAKGQKVATAVGAAVSAVEKVNYFDLGVRYHVPTSMMAHPYVAFGVGVAQVTNETVFSINGAATAPENLGIQSGTDLNGTLRSTFMMFGVGVDMTFATRCVVDISYRYGRISAKTSEIENDVPIPTNRVQVGIGIRF